MVQLSRVSIEGTDGEPRFAPVSSAIVGFGCSVGVGSVGTVLLFSSSSLLSSSPLPESDYGAGSRRKR